jgi:hypothetical protein
MQDPSLQPVSDWRRHFVLLLLLLPAGAIMEEVISSVKGGGTGHTHIGGHRI